MPPLQFCGIWQHFASDDLVVVASILAALHGLWTAILAVFASDLYLHNYCVGWAVDLLMAEAVLTAGLFLTDTAVAVIASRGAVFESSRRRSVPWLLYTFFAVFIAAVAVRISVTVFAYSMDTYCTDEGSSRGDYQAYRIADQLTWIQIIVTTVILCLFYISIPNPNSEEGSWRQKVFGFHGFNAIMRAKKQRDPLTKDKLFTERVLFKAASLLAKEAGLVTYDVMAGLMLYATKQATKREQAINRALTSMSGKSNDIQMAAKIASRGSREIQDQDGPDSAAPPCSATSSGVGHNLDRAESAALTELVTLPALPLGLEDESKIQLTHLLSDQEEVNWQNLAEATYFCRYAAAAYGLKQDTAEKGSCTSAKDWDQVSRAQILSVVELDEEDLIHVKTGGAAPYFIAIDRRTNSVVLSIRGLGNLTDVVVDILNSKPVPLAPYLITPIEQIGQTGWDSAQDDATSKLANASGWLSGHCNPTLLQAAVEVIADLQTHSKLTELLIGQDHIGAPSQPGQAGQTKAQWQVQSFIKHKRRKLVVTGHSMGAGVASVVGLKLEQGFPNLKAFCYCPPGKDIVPRLNLRTMLGLRDGLLKALAYGKCNKWTVLWRHYVLQKKDADKLLQLLPDDVPAECMKTWQTLKDKLEDVDAARGKSAELNLPGRVMFLRPHREQGDDNLPRNGATEGVWVSSKVLHKEGILLSFEMLQTHHMAEVYLWLLDSLARSQLNGATGVSVEPAPQVQASGPSVTGPTLQQASFSAVPSQRIPSSAILSDSKANSTNLSASVDTQELGLRVLSSWVASGTSTPTGGGSGSAGQRGAHTINIHMPPEMVVTAREQSVPSLEPLQEGPEGPSN